MSTDFEELVSDSLRHRAEGVIAPAGLPELAARARRRHRRRQLGTRSALTAATAAAAAAAIVIATGTAQTEPSEPRVQTAAYILSRTDQALASAARRSFVTVRTTFGGPGVPANIFPFATGARITRTEYWSFGNRSRVEAFAGNGKLVIGAGTRLGGALTVVTGVQYLATTWWRALVPPGHPITGYRTGGARPRCNIRAVLAAASAYADLSPGWPDAIRDVLACQRALETSRQVIDGQRVIRIEPKLPSGGAGVRTVYWVSASTYLPVRILVTADGTTTGSRWWQQEDYSWQRPSAANLAGLTQAIPAGFHRVPSPLQLP